MTELYPEWIKTNEEPIAVNTSAKHGRVYLVDVTSNAVDVQLPAAAVAQKIRVKHVGGDLATNALTVTPQAGQSIDGTLGPLTIESDYLSHSFVSNGTNWFII